ncbi:uncharacterized protein PAF06_014328 [Gastrophryne carolinensis]
MDTRHHPGCFSGPLYLLQHPCANLPCPSAMTYIRADDPHEHPSAIPTPQSYPLSTSHGFEESPLTGMHPLKSVGCHVLGGECHPAIAAPEPRLYRSLENLHWAESSMFAHYRSMDSEFILHCRSTRNLSEGSAGGGLVQSMMDKLAAHRDLPMPPFAKLPHWLFPTADDSDGKRELKEKLRTHSAKPVEPAGPVRPQTFLADCLARAQVSRPCQHCKWTSPFAISSGANATARLCSRATPERIKQEARRRLQLRRQNSSPDLTLHQEDAAGLVKSKTAESFNEPRAERPRQPCIKGPLYIPTFEEFKKMRNKNKSFPTAGECVRTAKSSEEPDTNTEPAINTDTAGHSLDPEKESAPLSDGSVQTPDLSRSRAAWSDGGNDPVEHGRAHPSCRPAFPAPICSSPVPRSPLQALSVQSERHELVALEAHDANTSGGFPDASEPGHTAAAAEAHSTCCPSLILEATDLSGYSAKLQKMKDGLIGSALDLIKKSCSTENGDPAASRSCDAPKTEEDPTGSASCEKAPSGGVTSDPNPSLGGSGCRRSSSDMTHEAGDSGKSQRSTRLRPHFSDPMPTDAVKRKQLELQIAAAARHHAQRKRQDNGPVLVKANTTTTCSSGQGGHYSSRRSYRSRHRWSNISSLSTDSGIVGVNDEREECEGSTKPAKGREVERVDSGIGDALSRRWKARMAADAAASLEAWEAHQPCKDCGEGGSGLDPESRGKRRETLCTKCITRRMERKEAVMEFVNTETSYREDLRIIKEEFYLPMQAAGLLTQEQLAVVFSNIQELIDLNEKFLEVLQEEIEQALDQGDEDLITVCLGEIFLDFANMLPAFQTYCLQQPTSVAALNALEKEKELLRIFLDVSQNDNTALRRMNLRSFLIAPLQRATKYPLLLSRILKSTTEFHPDHGSLREAKSHIESHLEHINMKTKQEGNTWTLRSFRRESRKNREVTGIEMREMAIKQVGWPREETRFIKEGHLQLAQPTDGQWLKKGCKALKFQNVHALLMVNSKRASDPGPEGGSSSEQTVKDAVLVLIKDKSHGKFTILRDPLRLGQCVVSTDPDCEDIFELLEIRKEGFVFRDDDSYRTQHWFRQMKSFSRELGAWQRRRNALPNIMISTVQNRCSN